MARPLLLAFLLLPLVPLLPTSAAASHHSKPASTQDHEHLHHHGHRHRSPSTLTATARIDAAPSMHQNQIELEERQSLPPSFVVAADLSSVALPHPQVEAGSSASEAIAPPPVDEPTATTTTLPLPDPYRLAASPPPPPPVHSGAAEFVDSPGDELGLQQLAEVLTSLGYNEMASAAAQLADSALVASWSGAMTVFAAPDVFLQASCRGCSRHQLLLEHMALGYFPYSELAAAPTMKLPSASIGFCLNVAAETGPFAVRHVSLYVDGVEISHPELYDDGRYVVHGLRGFVKSLSHASCNEGTHQVHHHHHHLHRRHHRRAISAASSAKMIRDAISRLRDGSYGFVALAMRVKFAELEKLANLTVFALDDQAIFTGGNHGCVSEVRIVPGHRLTRADLLRLHPGTVLPTLAGEDQKLVVTRGAGSATDEIRINYIPVKNPDVAINSRVAVHGIKHPFGGVSSIDKYPDTVSKMRRPRRSRNLPGTHKHKPGGRGSTAAATAVGLVGFAAAVVAAASLYRKPDSARTRWWRRVLDREPRVVEPDAGDDHCGRCFEGPFDWRATCCGRRYCLACLADGYAKDHNSRYNSSPCRARGELKNISNNSLVLHPSNQDYFLEYEESISANSVRQLGRFGSRVVVKRVYASWIHV